jgi:hypothetical protein
MFTKRKVLSAIAKIYDPLQLIGPVIVKAKLIMQELWKREIGWDEELPEDLKTSWTIILNQLHLLNQIRIPRKVIESYPYKARYFSAGLTQIFWISYLLLGVKCFSVRVLAETSLRHPRILIPGGRVV